MSDGSGNYRRVSLDTLAAVDPETLPISTSQKFAFKYIDISAAADGKLTIPSSTVEYGDAPSRARRIIRSGDVIMSTVRPNLKAFAYCQLDSIPYVASTGFAVLRAKENVVPYFLLCSLLGDDVTGQINRLAVGSNYPAINSSDVRRLQLPDLSERDQKRIAAILTSIDTAIEKTEALIAKYQQIKAGLMHDLFTRGVLPNGQLRPPREQAPELYGETELGWMPFGWTVTSIEKTLHRIIDYRGKTPDKTVAGIPLITAKNVRMGFIDNEPREFIAERDYAGWMTRGIPSVGDILFTTEAPLGNVAQIESASRVAFAQRVIILQPREQIDSSFLSDRLMSETTQTAVHRLASGSTALGIKQSEFRKVSICFPHAKQEQKEIAARLRSFDEYLDKELESREKLKTKKLGLMQDLLTGKVAVKVDAQALETVL